jgi:hypothetical protein
VVSTQESVLPQPATAAVRSTAVIVDDQCRSARRGIGQGTVRG